MRIIFKQALFVFLWVAFTIEAIANINAKLEFSSDDGKTYDNAFPIISQGGSLLVKVSWQGEKREIKDNVLTTILFNDKEDFASANVGKQRWNNGQPAWFQRLKKYWFNAKKPGSCTYDLDLGERKKGLMGFKNKWDKDAKKFVNGPLPACAALPPGEHKFTVRLSYRLTSGEKVDEKLEFFVTIHPGEKTAVLQEEPKPLKKNKTNKTKLKPEPLPVISGDYVFSVEKCKALDGKKSLNIKGPFIKSSDTEFVWNISGIKRGKYFIKLMTQSGWKTGEEDLAKGIPFLYLNGKAIHFDRAGELIPYRNCFVSIIQSREPLMIKNGDEIRWNRNRRGLVGTAALSQKKMEVSPVWINPFFDPYLNDYFRIDGDFALASPPKKSAFKFTVKNVKGSKDSFKIKCRILDYFQNETASLEKDIELKNREVFNGNVEFKKGNSDRYRAIVSVIDSQGNSREIVKGALTDDLLSVRKKIWLNKDWKWISIADDKTLKTRTLGILSELAKNLAWRKVDLPARWLDNPKLKDHHLAWYKKNFFLPEKFSNQRCFIHFSRVAYECRIYLNGKEIGRHANPNGPFDVEATSGLIPGKENELAIGVRDKIASLEDNELKNKNPDISMAGKIKAPIGLRAGVGEIYIYSTPELAIKDVFVKTSFRNKKISVDIELPKLPKGCIVSNKVLFAGNKELTFEDAPTNAQKINVSKSWPNPILWGPEKFPLLQLTTELRDKDGKILDCVNTRFGFREFWAEGKSLKLNGKNVKFGSRPFLSTWGWNLTERNKRPYIRKSIRTAKRMGCGMLRHIYNSENYASIADEEGILMAQGGANVIAGHTKHQLDSDEFWKNVTEFGKELVRGLRNHPSIVEWYLSNEYYGESEKRNGERLKKYGEEILKVDDSRLIEFGCDLDLRDFAKLISTHYPVDVRAFRMPEAYLPEAAYWRRFDQKFTSGMKVPAGMCKNVANVLAKSPITWGYKPIIVNETCWVSFFKPPDGLTRVFSDKVYESPWAVSKAHDIANTWFARGHRDADVSAITLWKYISRNPNWISLPKIDINVLQKYNKFYGGAKTVYDVNLTRDKFNEADLVFEWKLMNGAKTLSSEERNLHFNSCELKREKIALAFPEVDKETELLLELSLKKNAKDIKKVDMPIRLYPDPSSGSFWSFLSLGPVNKSAMTSKLKIGIFDKTGESIRKFNAIWTGLKKIDLLSKENLQKLDVLIIGEKQSPELLKKHKKIFEAFVEKGGKVILLPQEKTQDWLPVKLDVSKRSPSINYSFRPSHPLLKGIYKDELSYWNPKHKTGDAYYIKPKSGNFKSIVESGGPSGNIYVGLLEILKGKGAYICTQLDILDDFDKNPVSRKFWENIRDYCAVKTPVCAQAVYVGPDGGAFKTALTKLGVALKEMKRLNSLGNYQTIIMDASANISEKDIDSLRDFVKKGGKLLIHKVSPDSAEKISSLCGTKLNIYPLKAKAWLGRAVLLGRSHETAGLTNYDIFWRARPETQDYRSSYYSSKSVLDSLGKWSIKSEKAQSLLYPSLLAKIKLGKGIIILDNINWESNKPGVSDNANRIGSVLLTNLGVKTDGATSLEVPENLSYSPIDISKALNRSFIDSKDFDGKGGWTDQGPDSDLRSFPLDKPLQVFRNVPFRIEKPQSCLVLNSKYRPGAPENANIPIRKKADVLFFLQSSAWTSAKHHGSYFVNYSDGSDYEIKLIGGVNLRDWASSSAAAPFLYELDTITKLAWSGKNKKYGNANLYMMAWLNPYPDKEISSITFKSKNIGIPILVAITAATKTHATVKAKSTAAQITEAKELNKKAENLIKEKKLKKAEKTLKEAIGKAWDYPASYLNLGYLYENSKKWNQAIEVYENLLKSVPKELEAYYRIGKCWEAQGKYEKALETYRKSLKADINQPDIMKALEDVKKKMESVRSEKRKD